MSRGFHAFFRQYYNLRAVLRRADPALAALRPLDDYPLARAGGRRRLLRRHPAHPAVEPRVASWPAARASTSPALAAVDVEAALGLLDVDFPDTFVALDGVSAAEVLDRLRFPEGARHLALEVFARSFFADPREFSGAELVAMFHLYFVGSAEGLLFDVPRDDYDSTLWAPLGRHLHCLGVDVRTGREVRSVTEVDGGLRVLHAASGSDDQEWSEADGVVIALDPTGLRRLLAASPGLGGDGPAAEPGASPSPRVRSAPAFAVWRLWLSGRVAEHRAPFLGTSGYGPLDNVSVLERFEDHATSWAAAQGGSVVELHAYALPDGTDEADLRQRLLAELHRLYPETAGLRDRPRGVARPARLRPRRPRAVGLAPGRRDPRPAPRPRRRRDPLRPARRPDGAGRDDRLARRRPAPDVVGAARPRGLVGTDPLAVRCRSRGWPAAASAAYRSAAAPTQLVEPGGVDEVVGPELGGRAHASRPARAGRGSGRPGSRCRSEVATTASVITVTAGWAPGAVSGVAWVSTTLPMPSPPVIVMTTVCESGQVNSARTGTAKVRPSR